MLKNLFAAKSQYASEISTPIHFLPKDSAAIAVVPLPEKGSKIISALVDSMHIVANSTGNGAG